MVIFGEVRKKGAHFSAIVHVLGAFGQGRSRRAACEMLARIVLEIAASHRPLDGFEVTVTDDGEATCCLASNDPVRLTSLLLRCQREEHEMSLADVAAKLGGHNRSGYAQYEQGRREPSIGKLQELLDAVAPELALAIIPRSARVLPRWDEEADDEAELDAVLRDPSPANIDALRAKHRQSARRTG